MCKKKKHKKGLLNCDLIEFKNVSQISFVL